MGLPDKEPPMTNQDSILSVLKEGDVVPPPTHFRDKAHIKTEEDYRRLWLEAKDQPETFWSREARQFLTWDQPFRRASPGNWEENWFDGGKINACVNALDRHLPDRAHEPALIWEGENGEKKTYTYEALHLGTLQIAQTLVELGLKKGDRAAIYMPMVPEILMATLACARLGVIHSVIFAGFSPEAIALRLEDTGARLVLTADGGYRRGQTLSLKSQVDEALSIGFNHRVEHVLVLKRTGEAIPWVEGRDQFFPGGPFKGVPPAPVPCDSSDPLFILYTSGSTGKPKGILHRVGGYLMGAALSFHYIFDVKPGDIFWCTADCGWITGHTYLIYGPLMAGSTIFMYEGAPQYPDWGRFWRMIQEYRVSIFYTAPTAIRSFMAQGESWPQKYDLSSLRLLGSVGEPINPEAWLWYHRVIGKKNCPVVDTWWQTETGSIMVASLPGVFPGKPGSAGLPFFGVVPEIVDGQGEPIAQGDGGFLTLAQPWPSLCGTIWNDPDRYKKTYFSKGRYITGDGARMDRDGYLWIMGRVDDVINVSGHRLSTMEIESALITHKNVSESAAVGVPDPLKGQGIVCFVVTKEKVEDPEHFEQELKSHIVAAIGALARPNRIYIRDNLPKTRSGKIMRRLLRDVAAGVPMSGDLSTLEDQGKVEPR
jgi:acetyl-CoA synthetase